MSKSKHKPRKPGTTQVRQQPRSGASRQNGQQLNNQTKRQADALVGVEEASELEQPVEEQVSTSTVAETTAEKAPATNGKTTVVTESNAEEKQAEPRVVKQSVKASSTSTARPGGKVETTARVGGKTETTQGSRQNGKTTGTITTRQNGQKSSSRQGSKQAELARAAQRRGSQQTRGTARRRTNNRMPIYLVVGSMIAIAAIILAFVLISRQPASNGVTGTTDPAVLKAVTTVDPAVLSTIGTGGQQNPVQTVPGSPQRLVGPNGKPIVFFWGAEFCPYCAGERWAVVVSLSRFGTFKQLPETTSSHTDSYPDTSTFTFHGSTYISNYIDFTPVEAEDRNQQPLESPTDQQQQLIKTYNPNGDFPYINIANIYQLPHTAYVPDFLQGLSQTDISIRLSDSSTAVSKKILGIANYMTAAICVATNNQPGSVCNSDTIKQIQKLLPPRTAVAGNGPQVGSAAVLRDMAMRRQALL